MTTNIALNTPAYNSTSPTWDQPLNNNATILDKVFGNTTSVSVNTGSTPTYTLITAPNSSGTGSTSQCMRFNLTGALAANQTVLLPYGISGMWIVTNATTGSFTVAIASNDGSNAAAGTSVSLPQGYSTLIYSDATNVKKADDGTTATPGVTSFSAGTTGLTPSATSTGNITLAGTLVPANGGTGLTAPGPAGNVLTSNGSGAWVSQAASAAGVSSFSGGTTGLTPATASTGVVTLSGTLNVANGGTGVTSSTGSGSNVLSTSPSLTTPNLGTPSAVTLTNATGLPIATGVSGLGTGVATFLGTPSSANLAAAVTDETGSGSLVFSTSPTLTTPALFGETFSTSSAVTAGTNSQGQGAITSDYNIITTAPNNPSGVTLPTATTGRRIIIVNKGANSVNVYPASGGIIDALATNASIALPVNNVMEFNASSTTQWYSTYNLYTSATAAAGVTSFSGGTTGLTPSTATTGAVTLAGTLLVANGGTGQTLYTNGQLLIGNTTGNTLTKATLTAGTGISVTNGSGSITITNSGVTSAVAGTGVTVSGSTGAVTYSIGQSVATSASPSFAAITASTGDITATAGKVIAGNANHYLTYGVGNPTWQVSSVTSIYWDTTSSTYYFNPGGTNGAVKMSNSAFRTNSGITNYADNGVSTWNTSSDITLKKDVIAITGASQRIASLNPVNFTWKKDDRADWGFIAQEFETVYPRSVATDENGLKSIGLEMKFWADLVSTIQTLQTKVADLEARLTAHNM